MSETIEILRKKIGQAGTLGTVVRAMKTLAAINIRHFEEAVRSLEDYFHSVALGLAECLRREKSGGMGIEAGHSGARRSAIIVFGSDLGLVGQFNDLVADRLPGMVSGTDNGTPTIIAVGERIRQRIEDAGIVPARAVPVPGSVSAVAPLVGELIEWLGRMTKKDATIGLTLLYNSPASGGNYKPVSKRLLPLDEAWAVEISRNGGRWPGGAVPQLLNASDAVWMALVREYLFVSLFRACAESLAAENSSRLSAMQRAEKNIDDMLEELTRSYHEQRQSRIDDELFDVVSGFEALNRHE